MFRDSSNKVQGSPIISFKKINPTHYTVKIRDAKNPFILSFGSSFSPGWKAYISNNSESGDEIQKTYFNGEIKELKPGNKLFDKSLGSVFMGKPIPELNHIKANGYSNAWYIDRTGDFEIIVFYEPQKAFYLGGIISIVTLILFLYILLRMKNGKN